MLNSPKVLALRASLARATTTLTKSLDAATEKSLRDEVCDVVEEFLITRREHNWHDGSGGYWLREMLRRPVGLDFSVEDGQVRQQARRTRPAQRSASMPGRVDCRDVTGAQAWSAP